MKKYSLLIILTCLIGIIVHSQDTLKPVAKIVSNYSKKQGGFTPFSLFTETKSLKQENYKTVLSNFTTAQINEDQLANLVKKKYPAISFSFPINGKILTVDLVQVSLFTAEFSVVTDENKKISYTP